MPRDNNQIMDNIELLELCFSNLEDYSEDAYVHTEKITPIITNNQGTQNQLMIANNRIIENISAFKVASESGNQEMMDTAVNNIYLALNTEGINCSEFSSYWAVRDVSYSVYKKTLKTPELKKEFIVDMIKHFLHDRHQLYLNHGYCNSTLQAVSDSKAHKANGEKGLEKVSTILNSFGFCHFSSPNINEFLGQNKIYIYPDKTEKELFQSILNYYNISFQRSQDRENKQTDFLIKYNGNIYIMEHKHMKEGGGGQDKQVNEIIDFVSYSEIESTDLQPDEESCKISYISFLDGLYFNVIAHANPIGIHKPSLQKQRIYSVLRENPQNYFVNTFGFKKLITKILEGQN